MRARALLLAASLVLAAVAPPARAVSPSDKHSALPASTGLAWSAVTFKSTRDAAELSGWWFEGEKNEPVLVLFDREKGSMGDLLPSVREFVNRGFSVMTFDYRDFGPAGPGAVDTLVQLAFTSRWVNDAEGALHFARARAGKRPVFALGQGLGGAVAVAAAARDHDNLDAVACEGLFRTLNELLRSSGLSQVPGAPERHRFLVETGDEPLSALLSLTVPLHVTIALKDDVMPPAVTRDVTKSSLSRIDRWVLPEAGHEGIELTEGYYDHMSGWFKRIAGMLKAAAAQNAGSPAGK